MAAPVNVKLQNPTISISNWASEVTEWNNLNGSVGGNPDFYPLTIKAAYIIGIIHDLCESVSYLLQHPNARSTTYIPAYGLFASGIEILGRCVNGNNSLSGSVNDLKTGFKWLASSTPSLIADTHVLITTSSNSYTIEMLTALRHFAAHGQATTKVTLKDVDYEILGNTPPLIADGLERYWNQLQNDDNLCNRLAQANVIALRSWPVLKSWVLFDRDEHGTYHTITELFTRFNWHV